MPLLVFTLHPEVSAEGPQEMTTHLSGGDAAKETRELVYKGSFSRFFQWSKHRQDVPRSLNPVIPKGCDFGVAEPKIPLLEDGAGQGGPWH